MDLNRLKEDHEWTELSRNGPKWTYNGRQMDLIGPRMDLYMYTMNLKWTNTDYQSRLKLTYMDILLILKRDENRPISDLN